MLNVYKEKTDNLRISKVASEFVEKNKTSKYMFGQFKQD